MTTCAVRGSSPRAWGKGWIAAGRAWTFRIIPTSVGKRVINDADGELVSDHPHERGEKKGDKSKTQRLRGSSPRAWGKVVDTRHPPTRTRIIPTSVGKSTRRAPGDRPTADHPHERGEKPRYTRSTVSAIGSSPRAWGKVSLQSDYALSRRIIPTSVGKRRPGTVHSGWRPDHPHERGEKETSDREIADGAGSSPRAWGKEPCTCFRPCEGRIIPTSVGKRDSKTNCSRRTTDHPHERGEKSMKAPFKER